MLEPSRRRLIRPISRNVSRQRRIGSGSSRKQAAAISRQYASNERPASFAIAGVP